MEDHPEVIEKQMAETRAALTEKLEALESKVADTMSATTDVVQDATDVVSGTVETVKETVEAVKESVQDTVEAVTESVQSTVRSVGEAFNLTLQTERHPWLVFGGSVVLGCVTGWALSPPRRREEHVSSHKGEGTRHGPKKHSNGASAQRAAPKSEPQPAKDAAFNSSLGWLGEQLSGLRNLAVSALLGTIRDMARRSVPESIGNRIAEEVDAITTRMGAQPIQGQVLSGEKSGGESEQGGQQKKDTDEHSTAEPDFAALGGRGGNGGEIREK